VPDDLAVIDEPSHPRVRAARGCHRRTGRRKTGRFLAEGPQAVREALGHPGAVVEVFATTEWMSQNPSFDLSHTRLHRVTPAVLDAVAETAQPQGVVAACRDIVVPVDVALAGAPRLVVVLAQVRDPGNAGTIIRTADAAGADAVVLTESSVDPLSGKCVRSSAGSVFHLPVAVDAGRDLVDALHRAGLSVLAADGHGDLDLVEAGRRGVLAAPTAWVVGNEAHGVPDAWLAGSDHTVRVPLFGQAESLNVAVAASVCLYGTAVAQRARGGSGHGGSATPD
jgi:TrmH family RNA methyltransferase